MVLLASFSTGRAAVAQEVKISLFNVDASPPIGSPLAYDPTRGIQSPLSCRGIVILSNAKPIVLCSVDWLGISNDAQTEFKQALAKAAKTDPDRVSVHVIHQHDAPRCDFTAEAILSEYGYGNQAYDVKFASKVFNGAAAAVAKSIKSPTSVSHLGTGRAIVENVASNRRILGPDGKVKVTRYTATRDPKVRALPVGTIDPYIHTVTFFAGEKPLAVLSFYATHPQSYYRTGLANPDFPGLARNAREKETGVPHIHFNGAGGNIGAGKWNDGSKENRAVLASRVEAGLKAAWETTKKTAIEPDSINWKSELVQLPLGRAMQKGIQVAALENKKESSQNHLYAAKHLAWIRRTEKKQGVAVSCLSINKSKIVLMPGELFVEYQLATQKLAPDHFVCMAAYGEYGMGYIGTAIGYTQGGYETSPRASRVGPGSEKILMDAVKQVIK